MFIAGRFGEEARARMLPVSRRGVGGSELWPERGALRFRLRVQTRLTRTDATDEVPLGLSAQGLTRRRGDAEE